MTTPVIIDAFVVILLVGMTVLGAKRGLLRTLAGLVIVVAALVGAGMIAATFSGPAARLAAPLIEERVSQRVEAALAEQAASGQDPAADAEVLPIQDLLELLGLDEEVRAALAEQIRQALLDAGSSAADAVIPAVVEGLAHSVIYGLLYILAFVLLVVLLKVLVGAMGLVLRLPGLRTLNALGGAVLGLMEGALLLFLAVWVLRRLGVSFEIPPLADAYILRVFTAYTPLSVLSFLQ